MQAIKLPKLFFRLRCFRTKNGVLFLRLIFLGLILLRLILLRLILIPESFKYNFPRVSSTTFQDHIPMTI